MVKRFGFFLGALGVTLLLGSEVSAQVNPAEAAPPAGAPEAASGTELDLFKGEELLNPTVQLAAKTVQKSQQAPAIVSVVTREEIEAYGARDLMDILRLIPGFEFGLDVANLTGISFRGIWAYEGKLLLMIDGMVVQDYAFGNENMVGSFPAAMIQRVEVVRGPGSALYGGFAEVAVINVITHQGEALHGARLTGEAGLVGSSGFSRRGNVSVGTKTDDFEVAVHVGLGDMPLSMQQYSDFYGGRLQLNEQNAPRKWNHIIAQGIGKGFTLNFEHVNLDTLGQDGFTTVIPPVKGQNAELYNTFTDTVQLKYQFAPVENLKVEPLVEYATGNPIVSGLLNSGSLTPFQGTSARLARVRGEVAANYTVGTPGLATLGVGFIRDTAFNLGSGASPDPGLQVSPTDLRTYVSTDSRFIYAQYLHQLDHFGLTVGARYENTDFGNAFAPRVGLTYSTGALNAKLLYGRAFRIPTPWQAYTRFFNSAGALHPETTNEGEAELGYRFSPHVAAKANLFYIYIDSPIVYNGGLNAYLNSGRIDSYGGEGEVQVRYPKYGGFANVAYARPGSKTSPYYDTPDHSGFLAAPPVKVNVGGFYHLGIFEAGATVTVLSRRPGQSDAFAQGFYGAGDATTPHSVQYYPALVLVGANLRVNDVLPGLDVNLSVHNLLAQNYTLIQPYYGGHAPLPTNDREFTLGLTWRIN